MRYYRIDLLDHYRGRLSSRRLRVLVQHLPRESALSRAVNGEAADWGIGEHLLAAAVDHLAAGNWMFATAHSPEHADPPDRPHLVPRPGIEETRADTPATPEEIAAFFGAVVPVRREGR